MRKDGRRIDIEVDGFAHRRRRRSVARRRRRPRATSASANAQRRSSAGRPSCSSSSPAERRCRAFSSAWPRFVEENGDDVLASILLLDRDGVHLRHGAAPSLPAAYCEAIDGSRDRPGGRILRHRGATAASACPSRTSSTTRSGATTAISPWRPACAPAGRRRSSRPTARCSARSRCITASARDCGAGRHRARRARDARCRDRDRARPRRGSGARERGALPRPLRERQRADRDRDHGRGDHGGQPRLRACPRLHPRRAGRHQPRRATSRPTGSRCRGARPSASSPARPRARRSSRSSSPRTDTR